MGSSWNNAQPVIQIAASQQSGSRGAQLWAVTQDYQLISTYEATPGSGWQPWSSPDWDDAPNQIFQVTACEQGDGCVQLFILDDQQQLWTNWQTSPGGGWAGWAGPNWNDVPPLMQLCSSQQGGGVGAQVWGITADNQLGSMWQYSPGSGWSGWFSPFLEGQPAMVAATAAQQNDPRCQIYVLDQKQQLWTAWQTAAGNGWSGWSGPNWNSTSAFTVVCAFAQSGANGAQLFAVDQNGALWTCYQQQSGSDWSDWIGPNWNGAPTFIALAAAQQNDGAVQAWGIDDSLQLWTTVQQGPSGDWSAWANS